MKSEQFFISHENSIEGIFDASAHYNMPGSNSIVSLSLIIYLSYIFKKYAGFRKCSHRAFDCVYDYIDSIPNYDCIWPQIIILRIYYKFLRHSPICSSYFPSLFQP